MHITWEQPEPRQARLALRLPASEGRARTDTEAAPLPLPGPVCWPRLALELPGDRARHFPFLRPSFLLHKMG